VLAGVACWLFLGGLFGLVAGALASGISWYTLHRAEPPHLRRARESAAGELPHYVDLVAAAIRSGAAPSQALAMVSAACPGPTADRTAPCLAQLRWGAEPARVWEELAADAVLAPLARAFIRAESSGSSVADAVSALADDLERSSLAAVEDRARTVGVKAALPLGLCLLPAFLLIGIVPTVAGLLAQVTP